MGRDLGLYGFSLGIKKLKTHLVSKNVFITIFDQNDKDLYDKVLTTLDNLINNQLANLTDKRTVLYSEKVRQVEEYIKENSKGKTIVFVERIYTAALLCQVLKDLLPDSRMEYLAGSKASIDEISSSPKSQVRLNFI